MIKYFYYERCLINGEYITKNEKVLYDKPFTEDDGYNAKFIKSSENILSSSFRYYIDVEKTTKYYGILDKIEQEVYDKLLFEQRNKKLETI